MNQKLFFIFSFAVAKALVFVGPLWLGNIAEITLYGEIEFYLSLATWLAILVGVGVPGSIPIQIIKNENQLVRDVVLRLLLIVFLVLLFLYFAFYIYGLRASYFFVVGLIGFSISQQFLSPLIKSHGINSFTPWVENMALHLTIFSALIYYLINRQGVDSGFYYIMQFISLAFLIILIFCVCRSRVLFKIEYFNLYKRMLRQGVPILLNGMLMMLAFNAGRVLLGTFWDNTMVGLYSYLFRLSGTSLILYQLCNYFLFKSLYGEANANLNKKVDAMYSAVALFSILACVVASIYPSYVFPDEHQSSNASHLFPIVMSQVNLWIMSAVLEVRINRNNLTKISLKLCSIPVLFATLCIIVLSLQQISDPTTIFLAFYFGALCVVFTQSFVLKSKSKERTSVFFNSAKLSLPLILLAY